jgi:HTH-type transcriptional regulator / antitoxin HipB
MDRQKDEPVKTASIQYKDCIFVLQPIDCILQIQAMDCILREHPFSPRSTVDYPVKTLSQLQPVLRGFRVAAGLTQAMVASRLGITQQSYAQFEADPAAAGVERLFKVLRLLNAGITLSQDESHAAGSNDAKPAAKISPKRPLATRKTATIAAGKQAKPGKQAKNTKETKARKPAQKSPQPAAAAGTKARGAPLPKKREPW